MARLARALAIGTQLVCPPPIHMLPHPVRISVISIQHQSRELLYTF